MSRNGSEWTRKPELPSTQFVDPRIYTDEGIFAEEQEKIFDKCWLVACHESELPLPHDYRLYEHPGGHNIIIIRDEDGAEETVGGFNLLGHLLGLLVVLHILFRVVREVGIAGWVPSIELHSPGLFEFFLGRWKRES